MSFPHTFQHLWKTCGKQGDSGNVVLCGARPRLRALDGRPLYETKRGKTFLLRKDLQASLQDPVTLRVPPSLESGSTSKNIPRIFFSAQDDKMFVDFGYELAIYFHDNTKRLNLIFHVKLLFMSVSATLFLSSCAGETLETFANTPRSRTPEKP